MIRRIKSSTGKKKKTVYPIVKPWVFTAEDKAMFRATDPTAAWLGKLSGEELRRYAGKWVAAKDCAFVASGNTFEELLKQLGDTDLQTVIIQHYGIPWTILR